MSLLDEISIVIKHFVVDRQGIPLGPMRDFYSGATNTPQGVLRNPFPFKQGQEGFDTMGEAQVALEKTKAHIEAVIALPMKERVGSSKYWDKR